MKSIMSFLCTFAVVFTATSAFGKLTTEKPNLKVSVSNFDKSFVYLKDDDGQRYKYPRSEFAAQDFKVHQKFSVDKKTLQKYKLKSLNKKKNTKKSQ